MLFTARLFICCVWGVLMEKQIVSGEKISFISVIN